MEQVNELSLEELTKALAAVSPTQWLRYKAEDEGELGVWMEYSTTLGEKLITVGKKKPETYHFKAISPDNLEDGKVTDVAITVPSTLLLGTYRLGVDRSKWYEEKRDNDVLEENKGGIGEIFERVNQELKSYE